jgi:hypothetical protein
MEIVELREKFANDESFRNELFAGAEPVVLQALQSKGYVVRSQDQEKEFSYPLRFHLLFQQQSLSILLNHLCYNPYFLYIWLL